jgi:hypothetical protein
MIKEITIYGTTENDLLFLNSFFNIFFVFRRSPNRAQKTAVKVNSTGKMFTHLLAEAKMTTFNYIFFYPGYGPSA